MVTFFSGGQESLRPGRINFKLGDKTLDEDVKLFDTIPLEPNHDVILFINALNIVLENN